MQKIDISASQRSEERKALILLRSIYKDRLSNIDMLIAELDYQEQQTTNHN